MKKLKSAKHYWSHTEPWIAGVLVIFMSSWSADELRDNFFNQLVAEKETTLSWFSLVAFLGFAACVFWIYRLKEKLYRPHTRHLRNVEKPEIREFLVLFLSDLYPQNGPFVKGVPDWVELSDDLDQDIENITAIKEDNKNWQWEMPLRAINHHKSKLRSLIVICSNESVAGAYDFSSIVRRYFRRNQKIEFLTRIDNKTALIESDNPVDAVTGWDFENFDDISVALIDLLDILKDRGFEEKQIMFDFTGGQKVTSVVAAAVTFNRKIKAQYVQTKKCWKVISYDIQLASSGSGGIGI